MKINCYTEFIVGLSECRNAQFHVGVGFSEHVKVQRWKLCPMSVRLTNRLERQE